MTLTFLSYQTGSSRMTPTAGQQQGHDPKRAKERPKETEQERGRRVKPIYHIKPQPPTFCSLSRQLLVHWGKGVANEREIVSSYLMQILDKKREQRSPPGKKMWEIMIINNCFNSELQDFHQFSEVASSH